MRPHLFEMNAMSSPYPFFDLACTVGRRMKLGPGQMHTAKELLAEMDHHGIAEALVVHSLSRETHPALGNHKAVEIAATSPRLHPAWAAMHPVVAADQPTPKDLLERMREHKVGALFLFTNQYRINLSDWCIDPLFEPLAAEAVPVVINPNEIGPMGIRLDETDWTAVVALCQRFPSLPVIVSESRMRRDHRTVLAAMEAAPNLHLEISGLWLHRGVEFIANRFGPERLLFGSNWPMYGQHMTVATVTLADLSDDAKRLIGGDNLRRLLRWCQPKHPEIPPTEPADPYHRIALTGQVPESMRFQDCHGHLGPRKHQYYIDGGDLEATVAELDRLNIDRVCAFHFVSVGDEQVGNDITIEAVRRYPDRFVGFAFVNPHRDADEILAELERCREAGLRGVKLAATYQGYPLDGPHIELAVRWAHEHRQIILNHAWGAPAFVERMVQTYPDALILTGHTTLEYSDIMQRHNNLYVCSCPLIDPGACEKVVAKIGAGRFMFGSDLLDLSIGWGLGPILFARISEAEKRMILGENLQRLLRTYSHECL